MLTGLVCGSMTMIEARGRQLGTESLVHRSLDCHTEANMADFIYLF
jgi:hypothetical protein